MAQCNGCSAPLPTNINRCSYCGVRNDVDLHGKHSFSLSTKHSDRFCPHCETHMQTVKLDITEPLYIERCENCFGLFFDPAEIESFLDSSVSNVFEINLALIKNINIDRFKTKHKFNYVKCPVCRVLMNRVNFGRRSGVIVDQCKKHGVWLDNGEITHLMEWKKAGGQLLHSQKNEKKVAYKRKSVVIKPLHTQAYQQQSSSIEKELLETVSSLVFKLFG